MHDSTAMDLDCHTFICLTFGHVNSKNPILILAALCPNLKNLFQNPNDFSRIFYIFPRKGFKLAIQWYCCLPLDLPDVEVIPLLSGTPETSTLYFIWAILAWQISFLKFLIFFSKTLTKFPFWKGIVHDLTIQDEPEIIFQSSLHLFPLHMLLVSR